MTDKFRIDSHKLIYHVGRVSDWLSGKTIYPVYMEVSPSGACNHRCTFCGLDFMEYKPRYIDDGIFRERLTELGRLGLKSVMYGGEGEPLLHKQFPEIMQHGSACGIDNAITTNGVLLTPEKAEGILPHAEWIKISINAGSPETYAAVHRTKAADFQAVVDNMQAANRLRREMGLGCTLGMQMILLPENRHEATMLAGIARDIGMDYLVIKPYSQHLLSKTTRYRDVRYDADQKLADELAAYSREDFSVIFRRHTMKKWDEQQRPYDCCQALPFWSYIDAGGNVWGCSCYLGDERFLYGNIYAHTFQEIWEGESRRKSLEWVVRDFDVAACRVNCRMDEINRYLWELKHPPAHVNFI